MKKNFNEWLTEKGIEDIATLDAEKQAELYNEFNELKRVAIEEAIDAKVSKEDIQEMRDELQKTIDGQMKQLNHVLKAQGIMLKKLENSGPVKEKTLKELLLEQKEQLTKLKNRERVNITIKAPGTMSIGTNVTGDVPQAMRVPGLNTIASRIPRLLDIVTGGGISSNVVDWVYQANKDGSAGPTAEGSTKNQIDFDLLVGSQKVEKTSAFIKVTDEMVDDIDFMAQEINNELEREVVKAVETGVYSGSGVTPNLNGIQTVSPAFAAGDFATAVESPNEVDVLAIAMNQIAIAQEGRQIPKYILMNPTDVTKLKLTKVTSTDRRYVERVMNAGSMLEVDGVPIIPTTLVEPDNYLIGDFRFAHVLTRQGLTIEVGFDSDDFTKNLRTVRGEWRGVCYIKNNDRTAFVKGTFAADITAITKP